MWQYKDWGTGDVTTSWKAELKAAWISGCVCNDWKAKAFTYCQYNSPMIPSARHKQGVWWDGSYSMREEAAKTTQAQSSHFPGASLATLLQRVLWIQSLLSAKGSCNKFPWDFAILLLYKKSSNLFLSFADSDGGIVAGALIGAILAAAIICIIVWVLTKKAKNRKPSNNEMQ